MSQTKMDTARRALTTLLNSIGQLNAAELSALRNACLFRAEHDSGTASRAAAALADALTAKCAGCGAALLHPSPTTNLCGGCLLHPRPAPLLAEVYAVEGVEDVGTGESGPRVGHTGHEYCAACWRKGGHPVARVEQVAVQSGALVRPVPVQCRACERVVGFVEFEG